MLVCEKAGGLIGGAGVIENREARIVYDVNETEITPEIYGFGIWGLI
eukprot:SAG31_NODE_16928_length_690_cov_0.788494_2_plen_46_part_01